MNNTERKTALVVTSIASPNNVLKSLAAGALKYDIKFYVIGDTKSPAQFELEGCLFYSIEKQRQLDFSFAQICPEKHYTRKNIGYLLAIEQGANLILETDDDNFPREEFWLNRRRKHLLPLSENHGWLNVYNYFTDKTIWPRGFALENLQDPVPDFSTLEVKELICPVQQGLADDNPDVDAIYRLAFPLPITFSKTRLAIGNGSWCPFNSQNTSWFEEAFPLMYLPSYCSFRMTDIWRSFVAQRIMWENNWHLMFHEANVWQDRNEHNLIKDFQDEIPGYINNSKIADVLQNLNLKKGIENLAENLLICYNKLIEIEVIGKEELKLLQAWLNDIKLLGNK